jgi:hypothetical protein
MKIVDCQSGVCSLSSLPYLHVHGERSEGPLRNKSVTQVRPQNYMKRIWIYYIEIETEGASSRWVTCFARTEWMLYWSLHYWKAGQKFSLHIQAMSRIWLVLYVINSVHILKCEEGRDTGFDSLRFRVLWEAAGLERGPLSLVRTTEELLGRKSSGSGQENWH